MRFPAEVTHFVYTLEDKATACGLTSKGRDRTVKLILTDCKNCKNMYKLREIKVKLDEPS